MRDPARRSALAIHDMLDAIAVARTAVAGLSYKQFAEAPVNRLAVERSIEIVSEASRRVAADLKDAEPTIPWPRVAAIGNVLRHNYREVAPRAIWNLVENDLDPLEAALRRMLAAVGDE